MHFSYARFLENQIRKAFTFEGTPIRIIPRKTKVAILSYFAAFDKEFYSFDRKTINPKKNSSKNVKILDITTFLMITLYQNIDGYQYLTKNLDHSRFLLMYDIKKIIRR